jgi:serine/threonine protein kinase
VAAGDYMQSVPFTDARDETGGLARSVEVLKRGAAAIDEQRWVKSSVSTVVGELQGTSSLADFGQRFLALSQHARRIGAVVETISEPSIKRLRRYRWPGDVGELQRLIERAVTSARGSVLEIDASLVDEGLPLGLYRLMEKLGMSETGSFYFVMELLSGMDLSSLVQRFGPLPPERVVSFLRQACRSLGEAHSARLLHRDIEPQNLFLCRLGIDFDIVKVLDFGLVKSLDESATQLTAVGTLTGTPAYMPPERVVGRPADERSDFYSLGCVSYWMLTGQPVFSGEPLAVMVHYARTAPKPKSALAPTPIPDRLERIILSCLEKPPEKQQFGEVPLTDAWTPQRAQLWWLEHLPSLSTPPSPAGDSSGALNVQPIQ